MPRFKIDDIIKPRYLSLSDKIDWRRKVLAVNADTYTIKFLGGKQLTVDWPIEGVDNDHMLLSELADIIREIELEEESSVLWKFHRYLDKGTRWNALFIIPFKHMWE